MIIEIAQSAHLADMVRIINGLIAMGDNTAHRTPFTQDRLWDHIASNTDAVSRLVAVRDGHVLGFNIPIGRINLLVGPISQALWTQRHRAKVLDALCLPTRYWPQNKPVL